MLFCGSVFRSKLRQLKKKKTTENLCCTNYCVELLNVCEHQEEAEDVWRLSLKDEPLLSEILVKDQSRANVGGVGPIKGASTL